MTYGNSVTASYDTVKDNDAENHYPPNIFLLFMCMHTHIVLAEDWSSSSSTSCRYMSGSPKKLFYCKWYRRRRRALSTTTAVFLIIMDQTLTMIQAMEQYQMTTQQK